MEIPFDAIKAFYRGTCMACDSFLIDLEKFSHGILGWPWSKMSVSLGREDVKAFQG